MRILVSIFILSAVLAGCKKQDGLGPFSFLSGKNKDINVGTSIPFGIYNLSRYELTNSTPYDITLEIKDEHNANGDYIVSGKSVVNFYFAGLEALSVADSISISDVGSTKIGGSSAQINFEKDYLDRLEEAVSYEVRDDGNQLILRMPERYMIFHKK